MRLLHLAFFASNIALIGLCGPHLEAFGRGRLAMNAGYHFSENAHVVIGAAYDVGGDPFYGDGRGAVRYDGGFGRVVVTW